MSHEAPTLKLQPLLPTPAYPQQAMILLLASMHAQVPEVAGPNGLCIGNERKQS